MKNKKPQTIVTKEWLAEAITKNPVRVIGRALLAIYNNQTASEQESTATIFKNGLGFCKPDSRVGSIGARMYKSKSHLDPWLVTYWSKLQRNGFPKVCKYADQLNDIAIAKLQAGEMVTPTFRHAIKSTL
jgi:hypothetical protein